MRELLLLIAVLLFATPAFAVAVGPVNASENTTATPQEMRQKVRDAAREYRAELKAMSRAERRALKRQQKTQLKEKLAEIKAQRQRGQAAETSTVLLIILAVLLPPVAVLVHQGEVNDKFWISLLLTLLFWIPGVIYALITIFG